MAGKIRKLTSLAIAFMLVCLVAEGILQLCVVAPQVVLASPAEVTYYFNAHDAEEVWANDPDYMTDGDLGTYAYDAASSTQLNNSNTCPGTDLGSISKVELRAYGYGVGGNDYIYLRPVFGGVTDGSNYPAAGWTPPVGEASATWSPYYDITTDANAPSPSWTWSDVQDLDVDVEYGKVAPPKNVYIAKVEIEVTYTAAAQSRSVSQGVTIADGVTTAIAAGRDVSQGITIADGVTAAVGRARDVRARA